MSLNDSRIKSLAKRLQDGSAARDTLEKYCSGFGRLGKSGLASEKSYSSIRKGQLENERNQDLPNVLYEAKISSEVHSKNFSMLTDFSRKRKLSKAIEKHRMIWIIEYKRLQHDLAKLELFLRESLDSIPKNSNLENVKSQEIDFQTNVNNLAEQLEIKRKQFHETVVEPLSSLVEDLKFWMREFQSAGRNIALAKLPPPEPIKELLGSVRLQQKQVVALLDEEERGLQQRLNELVETHRADLDLGVRLQSARELHQLSVAAAAGSTEQSHAEEGEDADLESADGTGTSPAAGAQDVVAQLLGIPAAAYALECSDERCRRDALAEFLELDAQFSERLEQLDGGWEQRLTHYSHVVGLFTENDRQLLCNVIEQYIGREVIVRRHTLLIARLMQLFPRMSRSHLLEACEWHQALKQHRSRRAALLRAWRSSKLELLQRLEALFVDADERLEQSAEREREKARRTQVTAELLAQLRQWRELQREKLLIEQRLEAERARAAGEKLERDMEVISKRRQEEKLKIGEFRAAQRAMQEEAERRDRERLAELKRLLAEQAEYDRQRVEYRAEKRALKLKEREAHQELALAAEREREARLEAIREQVRPEVASDAARAVGPTAAWAHRQLEEEEPVGVPDLFPTNSFKSQKILNDPRVRLEMRLREAGLEIGDYARSQLACLQPGPAPQLAQSKAFPF